MDNRRCGKGKPCGATCIEKIKECLKDHSKQVSKSLGQARNFIQRAKENLAKEIEIQEKLRAQGIRAFLKKLSEDRGDGQGSHLDNPNEKSFKIMAALYKFSEERDSRLNRLEGRELVAFKRKNGTVDMVEPKRWYPDEIGLDKLSERMKDSPSEARLKYEKRLVEEIISKGEKFDNPKAIFMMGGPASGKSTLIKGLDTKGFVVIDPDEIKTKLPEFLLGAGAGYKEIAHRTQSTSARIAATALEMAKERGVNILIDGTGANVSMYRKSMKSMKDREQPYTIQIIAQHVPKAEGIDRAYARAELPLSMGGGRYVPRDYIERAYDSIPGNFLQLVKKSDSATLNDGEKDKVIAEFKNGSITSSDATAMEQYVMDAKGG